MSAGRGAHRQRRWCEVCGRETTRQAHEAQGRPRDYCSEPCGAAAKAMRAWVVAVDRAYSGAAESREASAVYRTAREWCRDRLLELAEGEAVWGAGKRRPS